MFTTTRTILCDCTCTLFNLHGCCLQFINIFEKAYPDNNVSVKIDSIVPGSVVVNTTTTFLDGDLSAANSDAKALTTAPGKIFPADTYGDVTTSDVSTGTAVNPAGNSHHPMIMALDCSCLENLKLSFFCATIKRLYLLQQLCHPG